mmetsp:Transcript_19364/g.34958  ORF Transcript_19364/g.34958 Transcript_19364/m.34958 type:complete len:260 (+) Transcript_19364:402-1181(+)
MDTLDQGQTITTTPPVTLIIRRIVMITTRVVLKGGIQKVVMTTRTLITIVMIPPLIQTIPPVTKTATLIPLINTAATTMGIPITIIAVPILVLRIVEINMARATTVTEKVRPRPGITRARIPDLECHTRPLVTLSLTRSTVLTMPRATTLLTAPTIARALRHFATPITMLIITIPIMVMVPSHEIVVVTTTTLLPRHRTIKIPLMNSLPKVIATRMKLNLTATLHNNDEETGMEAGETTMTLTPSKIINTPPSILLFLK